MRLSATTATARTFRFKPHVAMSDVAQTLDLSRIAAESLFGSERVELEAPTSVDAEQHTVLVESATPAGRALAVLFLAYAKREFGPGAIEIGGAA